MLHRPVKPMLLRASPNIPEGGYIHQLKWDGHRAILHVGRDRMSLYTRNGTSCLERYPELQNTPLINACSAILDGEMIVLDDDGKPCFELVMERFSARRQFERLASAIPSHFVVYDILYLNGKDITHLPLERRLDLLREVVMPSATISVCPSSDDGQELFKAVKQQGLEGIVSKKKGSRYRLDMRSNEWLKIKNYLYETVQIAGIRKGNFGWLLQKDGRGIGVLEFVPPAARQAFAQIAKQITASETEDFLYVRPLISCRVKFQCFTKKGFLRSPCFVEFLT